MAATFAYRLKRLVGKRAKRRVKALRGFHQYARACVYFELDRPFNQLLVALFELGRKYADTVMGLGGSLPAADVFKIFRGRAPTADALLRHCGLTS